MLRERERSGIEIDTCPQCRGIWLDRGELDKLLAREARYYTDDGDGYDRADRGRGRDRDTGDDWEDSDEQPRRRGFFQNLLDTFGDGSD
jgi:Zn-finger nucleic acid-binding protein